MEQFEIEEQKENIFSFCEKCGEPIFFDEWYIDIGNAVYHEECGLEEFRKLAK